jgi:hypothetical protein
LINDLCRKNDSDLSFEEIAIGGKHTFPLKEIDPILKLKIEFRTIEP